jgi:hypothetical protein
MSKYILSILMSSNYVPFEGQRHRTVDIELPPDACELLDDLLKKFPEMKRLDCKHLVKKDD